VSRASFCAAVYFMLKFRWALRKTLAFLQSKRPDLQPRPGFLRQLQALDASLQRAGAVSGRGAAGSGDEAQRAGEWVADAVPVGAEDELLIVHTFLNSQPAHEDVVVAAQSSAWLPREPAGTFVAICRRMVAFGTRSFINVLASFLQCICFPPLSQAAFRILMLVDRRCLVEVG
jgi:hypothetical protein